MAINSRAEAAREASRAKAGDKHGGRWQIQANHANNDLPTPDGPADTRDQQANDLSDLVDRLLDGPFIEDDLEAAYQIVPNVPQHLLSDQLWHDVLSARLARDEDAEYAALSTLVDLDAREARWRNDPTFEAPTGEETETGGLGPVHYTTVTGGKYTGFRDVAAVARDVRVDLKDAVESGYLPDDLQFRVTSSRFSMGQAVDVKVRGMVDKDIYRNDPLTWGGGQMYSATTSETLQRVGAIACAYSKDTTERQTDYAHVTYWTSVDLEDESDASRRVARAAADKSKRAARTH